jgi:uncharacterized protein with GYD domain
MRMPLYMVQESYSVGAIGTLVRVPQDRTAAVRQMVERMGGRLHGLWFALGEFDVVAIIELPDNTSAAALSMAIGASGAMSAYRTTPLLTMAEATEAMNKAGTVAYQAPE